MSALTADDSPVGAAMDPPEEERRSPPEVQAQPAPTSSPEAQLEPVSASSPELQPEPPPATYPNTAPAIVSPSELAARDGVFTRARAIALGVLALLAMFGIALGLQAPSSRDQSAPAPAKAVARPIPRVAPAPSPEVVALPPVGEALTSPPATEAPTEEALSVTQPASEEGLGAAPPAADVAPVAEAPAEAKPDDAPEAQAQPQAAIPSAEAPTSVANAQLVPSKAGPGAAELPSRLRRWLQPTPAQQRVIDAFWARVDQNFAKAERLLSEAHALDPKDAEVAYQLALTYARQGRLEQTLSWARKAAELSPLDPAPVALEGDIQALRGKRVEAEQAWKQCLRVRPGYVGCVRRLEQSASRPGR